MPRCGLECLDRVSATCFDIFEISDDSYSLLILLQRLNKAVLGRVSGNLEATTAAQRLSGIKELRDVHGEHMYRHDVATVRHPLRSLYWSAQAQKSALSQSRRIHQSLAERRCQ